MLPYLPHVFVHFISSHLACSVGCNDFNSGFRGTCTEAGLKRRTTLIHRALQRSS